MKIDRLSNLISSFTEKYLNSVEQKGPRVEGTAIQAASNNEAARVSSDFGLDESDKSNRKYKVDALKQEIAAGTYNPDSREVAVALLKELSTI